MKNLSVRLLTNPVLLIQIALVLVISGTADMREFVPTDNKLVTADALAAAITSATRDALEMTNQMRRNLPYGQIETEQDRLPVMPQLTTYPAPVGIVPSNQYAVTIEQSGSVQNSFVYKSDARKTDTNRSQDTSWTSFSFSGTITVVVRKLLGSATGCMVRPQSLQIATWYAGNTCYINLHTDANFSVEFLPNTQNPILHPMLVFANPPEVNVPNPGDPNVRYFGPGIHKIGPNMPIHSGETIYVAGGAWVEGTFTGQKLKNVVIKGRGVVSGLFLDTGNQEKNKRQPGLIDILDSANILVEGITFVDSPRFNVRVLGKYVTLRNLKIMSWWYSTDGVVAGNAALIEHNFIKVNDDSIKLHWGDLIVRHNVIWQLENGGPFNISWNIHENVANFHVYDNDVIHAEHYFLAPQAIFRSRHAGSGSMQRYLFADIRVEDANWRLFYIVLENNQWYDPARGYGGISDIVFRNIATETPFRYPNVVKGIDSDHRVSNIIFQDIQVGGNCVSDAINTLWEIDPNSTNAIVVEKGSRCE